MTAYIFEPATRPALPVRDSTGQFAVHRVYCVGRNYAAHAVEMGHDPDKEPPFFFQKNPDNIVLTADFPYPPQSSEVHHEIELVVAIGEGGSNISVDNAIDHVFGYGVGLDMTRRDLQGEAKKMGRPWETGKAFESSAPCSELVTAAQIGHPQSGAISLHINDELRQQGDLNQLIWKIPEVISILSKLFHLQTGDIIMTGTPSGVGPVHRGDRLRGYIENVGSLEVNVI